VREGVVGCAELGDEPRRDLRRGVRARVACDAAGPVDAGERVARDTGGVGHVEQRWEVILLRVARVLGHLREAGHPELAPEAALPDDEHGVAAGQREELGADAEPVVGDLGEHGALPARRVARRHLRLAREHLDVAGEPEGRGARWDGEAGSGAGAGAGDRAPEGEGGWRVNGRAAGGIRQGRGARACHVGIQSASTSNTSAPCGAQTCYLSRCLTADPPDSKIGLSYLEI
jgi:hypothetical protein